MGSKKKHHKEEKKEKCLDKKWPVWWEAGYPHMGMDPYQHQDGMMHMPYTGMPMMGMPPMGMHMGMPMTGMSMTGMPTMGMHMGMPMMGMPPMGMHMGMPMMGMPMMGMPPYGMCCPGMSGSHHCPQIPWKEGDHGKHKECHHKHSLDCKHSSSD